MTTIFSTRHTQHRNQKCPKSEKRWVTALIQKLWDVACDQWQHHNEVLHKKNTTLLTEQADLDIEMLFKRRQDRLRPKDKEALFKKSKAVLLMTSAANK